MLKYINSDVVFQEIPDEVTLAINLSNCPCRCPGCHSKFLWADNGTELQESSIDDFVAEFGKDITCICFMGGDAEPNEINRFATYIRKEYPKFRIGWYTGRTLISPLISTENFDYIKVGPYIAHLGALKNPKTNQHLYKINHTDHKMEDITSRFWKKTQIK
jgi:anaerobic ribonucleoside-triphosphate reductase activating protein